MKYSDLKYCLDVLIDEQRNLLLSKNDKYSGLFEDCLKNFKSDLVAPEIGITIRMFDKFNRLQTLLKNQVDVSIPFENESVLDTVMDIINYGYLFLLIIEDRKSEFKTDFDYADRYELIDDDIIDLLKSYADMNLDAKKVLAANINYTS